MNKQITYKQLLTVVISFLLGLVSVLIIQNSLENEVIRFDTIGLVGFLISILFGGASIVLAITAINLGKSSESIMIDRSEKSIELQNDVYIKTTEALKRIESSTGVTEKRIEDIIAGRVGDIANRLVDDKLVGTKDREKLENELRRSLSKELTKEEIEKREEERKKDEEARKNYQKYKDLVLLDMANSDSTKALRISEGTFEEEGEGLVDGLFKINEEKVGICIFYNAPLYQRIFSSGIDKFLNNLAEEISNETFDKVYLVFNEDSKMMNNFIEEISKIKKVYKDDIANEILTVNGEPNSIVDQIISSIN